MIHNTIRPKDLLIAHAFASLTTSSAFGETSVSILTPVPDSLDKFLHLTDTGSYWCFLFCANLAFEDRGQIEIEAEIEWVSIFTAETIDDRWKRGRSLW